MKQLAKAVLAVMSEVQGMEKNSRVGTGGHAYDGTKYADVAEVFNKAMINNDLCILPIEVNDETQVDRWEETNNYGTKMKQSVFTKVRTKYLLLHNSGESVELAGYGHGVDPQDKSAGKATTYALKNVLLYTFLTPVGKMDDTDTKHSKEMDTPPAPKQPVKTKPVFTSANFKKAHELEATIDQIKTKYEVQSQVEAAYKKYCEVRVRL